MKRNILIVEPGFKTKFPPLGLMKISAYHKKLGDNVKFVKGINKQVPYENFWHRIYVATLFTYQWKITVETIKYYKELVKGDTSRIIVGGIMASLIPEELWKETGIVPLRGLLCESGALGDDNKDIIDDMIPDYELFSNKDYVTYENILDCGLSDKPEQKYSLIDDSYFGYLTRGCIRKCKFCGVRFIEPTFIEYRGIKPYIEKIKNLYGERCHLVLFDNNVLASKRFKEIINDLKDLGFEKGQRFEYKNKAGRTISRERHVDFNQGIDARLMSKSKVKSLSEIALSPVRIAFDHIKDKEIYSEKVRLVAENGIVNFSNYVLYNYNDTPKELWQRLKLNIDLNKELGLQIYSFPMKYIPLNAKTRSFIDEPNWNWQYIRGVQRILNVVKGSVMTSEDFFHRAFGENEKEFLTILHMPENILMNRTRTPQRDEKDWTNKFQNLISGERNLLLSILCENRSRIKLRKAILQTKNQKLRNILDYYLPEKVNAKNLSFFKEIEQRRP